MKKRYLTSILLSKEGEVFLGVRIIKYNAVAGAPERFKKYESPGYDPQWQRRVDVASWDFKATTLAGLSEGIRANLSEVLLVLGENGFIENAYQLSQDRAARFDCNQFNTGNDLKLVFGFVNFLTEIIHSEEA